MRTPSLKKRFENTIQALSSALGELYVLTENLSLFDPINNMALELAQAIEALLEDIASSKASEIIPLVKDSELFDLLEGLQDTDWVSELESILLDAAGQQANPEIAEFINQMIEKIELKYHQLLSAGHAFNSLIPIDD